MGRYRDFVQQVVSERLCLYCGVPGQIVDNHIPRSMEGFLGRVMRRTGQRPEIPICQECRTLAQGRDFLTPEQKRNFIREGLVRRHGGFLSVADWAESEIDSLGYTLRTAVVSGVNSKTMLQARLVWPRRRPKPRQA